MPRIITALFEDRGAADGALQALVTGGIARDRIAILGESHQRASELAPTRSVHAADSALPDISLPREDLELYAEGLRRGCVMVTARIDGDRFEDAIATLDMFDPVDLDSRAKEWRQSHGGGNETSGVDVGAPLGAGLSAGVTGGSTNTSALPGSGQLSDATHDVGSADLRTDEASLGDQGRSTDTTTGDRRADQRADAPGALELGAAPDLFRRETTRSGRVRSYVR